MLRSINLRRNAALIVIAAITVVSLGLTTWLVVNPEPGPTGPQGEQGPAGPPGPPGPPGEAGADVSADVTRHEELISLLSESLDATDATVEELRADVDQLRTELDSLCSAIDDAYLASNSATDESLFALTLGC